MGSPKSDPEHFPLETPQTIVTLTKGFWMGKYEVTQGEYQTVMRTNPAAFKHGLDFPVERVRWTDATNYCARLTERERAAGRLVAGYEYRLPTEAQWEYACRAGTTTPTAYGGTMGSKQANFNGRAPYPFERGPKGPYVGRTTKVGSYPPNAWGLYDMHANVEEWCADWYLPSFPGGSVTDPKGPDLDPGQTSFGVALRHCTRVARGGRWNTGAQHCRSASRRGLDATVANYTLGFRVALVPQEEPFRHELADTTQAAADVPQSQQDVEGSSTPARQGDEPPWSVEAEKAVLKARNLDWQSRAQCEQLLLKAASEGYPPALYNLFFAYAFDVFGENDVVNAPLAKAADFRVRWLKADGTAAALLAIGEGYLRGQLLETRELLRGRWDAIEFPPDERNRRVADALYETETLSLDNAVTERLVLENYRVILKYAPTRGSLPPGNIVCLKYQVNPSLACSHFEKAAWKALNELKGTRDEEQQRTLKRILNRSLEVLGTHALNGKWKAPPQPGLPELMRATKNLLNEVPDVFQQAVGTMLKDSNNKEFLDSLGVQQNPQNNR